MRGSQPGGAGEVIDRWDRLFEVLAAEPRRRIVGALLRAPVGESVPLPEAAANPAVEPDLERLRLRLRHHHLPLLEREGIIQWERDPLRAYRGCEFEEAGSILQSLCANAEELPDRLVVGYQLPECERSGGDPASELGG